MKKPLIGVFIGSLRKDSYCKKIARELEKLAVDKFEFTEISMEKLDIYNQDFDDENHVPDAWTQFRSQVKKLDGLLFITPEYNRSIPALLKNALDVGSRPYGQSVWDGKPGAVVSVSPGALGGFGANQHLRQTLVVLNVPTMQQPEIYIGNVAGLLNEKGIITNEKTKEFLTSFTDAFYKWVSLFTGEKKV
ncbi:MAG: NAD(P)H-dependent oxidoreductase [Treponema sp.]|nr:NAD(P)H-dependent oxidoreductase [Treponema sp.]